MKNPNLHVHCIIHTSLNTFKIYQLINSVISTLKNYYLIYLKPFTIHLSYIPNTPRNNNYSTWRTTTPRHNWLTNQRKSRSNIYSYLNSTYKRIFKRLNISHIIHKIIALEENTMLTELLLKEMNFQIVITNKGCNFIQKCTENFKGQSLINILNQT